MRKSTSARVFLVKTLSSLTGACASKNSSHLLFYFNGPPIFFSEFRGSALAAMRGPRGRTTRFFDGLNAIYLRRRSCKSVFCDLCQSWLLQRRWP